MSFEVWSGHNLPRQVDDRAGKTLKTPRVLNVIIQRKQANQFIICRPAFGLERDNNILTLSSLSACSVSDWTVVVRFVQFSRHCRQHLCVSLSPQESTRRRKSITFYFPKASSVLNIHRECWRKHRSSGLWASEYLSENPFHWEVNGSAMSNSRCRMNRILSFVVSWLALFGTHIDRR